MPFKRPTTGAVLLLATFVVGGLALVYAPATPGLEDSWQARWGPRISALGLGMAGTAVIAFGVAHVRWPRWLLAMSGLRVKLYRRPYGPDEFLAEALQRVAGTLKVVKKTVEMQPYGWDERKPFVRITYSVFNGSAFLVRVGEPRGNLFVNESVLHEAATIFGGQGFWASQSTGELKLDLRMELAFWQELAGRAGPGQVLDILHGDFNVSLEIQHPGAEATRIGLDSKTPFLVEPPR